MTTWKSSSMAPTANRYLHGTMSLRVSWFHDMDRMCAELYIWWSHLSHADDHSTNRISAHGCGASHG